ncbi:hypothetical protein B0J13DRAFT_620160 [Dactylonectria estremocensis]|uniref:Uncharacterized protein n=1 Tax=Dactylonectria estremocensis TaxID=1079267 RepID=A0A9P9J8Y2_9HYPO|nr:hypothetical protein B0J13DRAFT_620160 [Dactylonectria estremocensis]
MHGGSTIASSCQNPSQHDPSPTKPGFFLSQFFNSFYPPPAPPKEPEFFEIYNAGCCPAEKRHRAFQHVAVPNPSRTTEKIAICSTMGQASLHIIFDSSDAEIPRSVEIDVVAVHGLNLKNGDNHARRTRTAGHKLWLRDFLLGAVSKFPRVMLFEYNLSPAMGAAAIKLDDNASTLLDWLKLRRKIVEKQVAMRASHSKICKFESADSPACELVLGIIDEELKHASMIDGYSRSRILSYLLSDIAPVKTIIKRTMMPHSGSQASKEASIDRGFLAIYRLLPETLLLVSDPTPEDVIQTVLIWFARDFRKYLMIFDEADHLHETNKDYVKISKYFPRFSRLHIIITKIFP